MNHTRITRFVYVGAIALLLAASAMVLPSFAQQESGTEQKLPTSKRLAAKIPGAPQPVNSFPTNLVISPDGRYAIALNNGYGTAQSGFKQSLAVIDLATNNITDFRDDRLHIDAHQSYFLGLAFGSDGHRLFASLGSITDPARKKPTDLGNGILVYSFNDGKVAPEKFLKLDLQPVDAPKIVAPSNKNLDRGLAIPYPAGLAIVRSAQGDRLLVAANLSDQALLLDANSGTVLHRFDLSTQRVIPGSYPYAVAVTNDGRRAYVSLWNASRVAELDLVHNTLIAMIPLHRPVLRTAAGSHPTALLFTANETRLLVALANSDDIASIETKTGRVESYLSAKLPGQKLLGVSPVALAQNAEGTRLFVADAGANALAILDISKIARPEIKNAATGAPLGFIPTEWYPQALAVHDGDLLIACGKGRGPGPTAAPTQSGGRVKNHGYAYVFELMRGSIARIHWHDAERGLAESTAAVVATNFGTNAERRLPSPEGQNPIHHVIYIIKENRTYDQVFGDLPGANGDPSLAMFGEDITPNQHKLAREFGILDNFYDSGEVSGGGHNWSTAAIASDYMEKTIQVGYRDSAERTYDYEGEVADRIPLEDDMPDVNESGTGYLWSNVARHHLTYRNYGEFVTTRWCTDKPSPSSPRDVTPQQLSAACAHPEIQKGELLPSNVGDPHGSPSPWPWPVPMIAKNVATKPELRNHFDPRFANFETEYPDQLRVDEFLNEFEGFVRAQNDGRGATLPNCIVLRLPNDHTSGTRPRHATPAAAVADNDLAVGRVADALSNSPYWKDTALLILEDDAQNGPDHVDAHRSTALVISAYSPSTADKPFRESGFYTTVSMIRTLEALLGLPPMNQNDSEAPVMASLFSADGHHPAFQADFRNRDNGLIYQMNPPGNPGAAASLQMDFSHADLADNKKLNEILWRDRMGDRPMPPPQHTVFPDGEN